MKTSVRLLTSIVLLLSAIPAFSQYQDQNQQQQEEKQKTPIEIATEQADKFQKDFGLNDSQTFLIDSVLQTNMTGVFNDFNSMKKGGVQSQESYRAVQETWMKKTQEAFKKILTPDQYIRYEKMTGLYAKRAKEEKNNAKARAKLEKEKAKAAAKANKK